MPELVQTDPNSVASEDVHLQRLLAAGVEEPWFKSLARNIQEAIRPPKLPPLELTSKPVAVKDIWGLYGRKRESGVMSLLLHTCVVVLMFTTQVDRKSTRLNSSHSQISYAVFCLKKKKKTNTRDQGRWR